MRIGDHLLAPSLNHPGRVLHGLSHCTLHLRVALNCRLVSVLDGLGPLEHLRVLTVLEKVMARGKSEGFMVGSMLVSYVVWDDVELGAVEELFEPILLLSSPF